MDTQVFNIKNIRMDKKLGEEQIVALYSKCVLGNSDFDSEGLTCNFSVGEGVSTKSVFSSERLNENREMISFYIDQLCDIEEAPSVMRLYYDKDGQQWTDKAMVVEMLIQMGTASDMVSLLLPPEMWHMLPGGVPFVGKNIYKIDKGVSGIKGSEYVKVFGSNK